MNFEAKQDPLFAAVRQMVLETRIPTVSLVQRNFRIGYNRASSLMAAMEGDIVTHLDEGGKRRMLVGETIEDL